MQTSASLTLAMTSEELQHASAKLVLSHSARPSQKLEIPGVVEDADLVDEEVGQAGSRPFNLNVQDTMSLQAAIKAKLSMIHTARTPNVDQMEISSPPPVLTPEELRHASAKLVVFAFCTKS
jgi:hypothetical protein